MIDVIPAEGAVLDRVLEAGDVLRNDGWSRPAFRRFRTAQLKTDWGRGHQKHYALVDDADLLASATRYDMAAILDGRRVRVCGIGAVFTEPAHRGEGRDRLLVERLLHAAAHEGADVALLFTVPDPESSGEHRPAGFAAVPMMDLCLEVAQSPRHGAPMTMIRGGEARDLAAIVAMGRVRAEPFRFHLDRDADFVQYAITTRRLRAGLGRPGARQLQFFIAEEGTTAAAYVVLSVEGNTWTVEECGDRDPSGARVGAILQALIAREPVERRPAIRAWLPPGFVPPQVTVVTARPAAEVLDLGFLRPGAHTSLSPDDVLYWRNDIF